VTLKPSTFVISITPFDAAGNLDEGAFRSHLQRLAASGIGVYVGGSGSGEGYTLTGQESRRLLEIAVEELKGKVPVRAMGVEPRTAKQMIEFLHVAKSCGVDAAQIYSLDIGHDAAPTPAEVEAYFSDVLEAVDLPVILSTHQSVGYRLPAPVLADLVRRYPLLQGINCTHPDLGYVASVVDAAAGKIPVHVGGPMQGLTIFALGGQGYLSSEANLAPKLAVSVITHFENNDMPAMMEAFGKLIRLFGAFSAHGGIRVTKAVLNSLGLAGGYPRRPRMPIGDDQLQRALAAVAELRLSEIEGW
jgi:4-hydroxy-tetrahydrodipicolinate synthase